MEAWKAITQEKWILQLVQEGLSLQFAKIPTESGTRETKFVDTQKTICILEEVENLLEKNAIERVPKLQEGLGFYSTFFIVPKKDCGFRPILNLRNLNSCLVVPHFKMETLRRIICALEKGDWALSIDLKDAYFHVAVHPKFRKYLRFCIQGKHFQFRAMPFGLATAPRIFTKLMSAVGSYLRSRKIQIYMYLDDWLIKNQDKHLLRQQISQVLEVIQGLGLLVNWTKSQLEPTQTIQYLGSVFSLKDGVVYPTMDRYCKLQEALQNLSNQDQVTAQTFLQLLGLMASFIDLTPFSRLHMRPIQFYVLSWWKPHKDSMYQTIPVKETLFQHLQWWTRYNNLFAGIPLATHTITIWTDASMFGWGAHMEDQQVSGVWNPQQSAQHINWLELKAVDLALHHFRHQIVGKSVLLRCDNSTVVSYIYKQGGTKSFQMCCLAWEVFQWSLQKGIVLKAAHIPGKRNILADHLSRGGSRAKTTEWSLCQEIVKIIFDIFTTPNIDLFATKENRKLQTYCSPFPDPLAWATDALSVNWTGMYAYAFPPPILIPQVLRKVLREECVLLLVAPFAPRQSWYPQLLNLLVEFPRKLPALEGMLTQKRGQFVHPSPESLNLVVWKITRNQNLQNDFLRKLGNTSSNPAGRLQGRCMMPDSPYIEAGVIKGKSVRILQL